MKSIIGTRKWSNGSRLQTLAHYAWLALFCLLILSTVAVLPNAYRNLIALSPEVLPDTNWTVEETLVAIQALHLSLPAYVTFQIVVRFAPLVGFYLTSALIFFKKPSKSGALIIATVLTVSAWGTHGIANLYESLFPELQVLFRSLSLLCFNLFLILLLIFPDGRFYPRWTLFLGVFMLVSAPLNAFISPLNTTLWPFPFDLIFPLVEVFLILYAAIYRYRKIFTLEQRQQVKWVVFSLAFTIFGVLLPGVILSNLVPEFQLPGVPGMLFYLASQIIGSLALLLIPITILISIIGYRLWDIDPIINRTLVYSLLTVSVILIYVIIVGYLGSLFGSRENWFVSLFATGIIAVLFQPLRQFLQNAINRWLFGERDDPYRVISRLGHNLETTLSPEAMLSTIVDTVRQAFRLPYAAVVLLQQGQIVKMVSNGNMSGDPYILPIVYQHETIGEFHLAPRAPGESFSPADRRLLEDLARQAGIAIHAVRATTELQQAREHLVSTREEERRRLRRDLHDGLGPQLASQTLTMDAVYRQIDSDPQAAKELLEKLKSQTRDAVRDIRRLVYDLRPPALDELGLIGALREMVVNDQAGLQVSFNVPDVLKPLPAAVEVAAFRIVQEAITNVIRHANATHCYISIEIEDQRLCLKIDDDGEGMRPNTQAGIGLLTMRERAEELGGTFQISESEHGGTQVRVRLPLPFSESSL